MRSVTKFRAWANEYNKYCDFVTLDENGRWIGWVTKSGVFLTTTDIILEQYTGLKDKNGKEIAEGDIVRRVEDGGFDTVGVVEWSEKAARFWVNRYYYPNGKKWEVIGNIHENGNLLKGENEFIGN